MKALNYALKTIIWSLVISIGIKVVFGLYAVFGTPALLIPIIAGIGAAISLSPPGNGGYLAVSLSHLTLVSAFSAVFDFTNIFRRLPSESAAFFADAAGKADVTINILWSILFVMPVYFLTFLIIAGIMSFSKSRRLQNYDDMIAMDEYEADEYDSEFE